MNGMSIGGVFRRLTTIIILVTALVLMAIFHHHRAYPGDEFESIFNQDSEHGLIVDSLKSDQKSDQNGTQELNIKLPVKCTSDAKVVFLKTHKTASSTIQNILMRWGTKLNKTFALPKSGKSIFRYWKSWTRDELFPLAEGTPDIIAHHMRFSSHVVQLWGDDALYISIVRNPVIMFESLFNYMKKLAPQFRDAETLENFLETPEEFTKLGKSMTGFFAKNHLSFEFGLDPWETDSAKVQQDIKQAQGQWDFVLINEHMAESLVILRRYLCMSVEDVACFITNARASTSQLSDDIQTKLQEWNRSDWLLYQHFNATLWRKIEQVGVEKVNREVIKLRKMVEHLTHKCVEGYVDNKLLAPEFRVYQPPGVKVRGIKLTPAGLTDPLCYDMAKPELPWTRDIMLRQGQPTNHLERWS